MIFQLMDNKAECLGYYMNGELVYDSELPENCSGTWKTSVASSHLRNIDYAHLYSNGLSLSDACPAHLSTLFDDSTTKLKAYLTSFVESRVSLKENCFFSLVPDKFLLQYFDLKNRICEHVFKDYTEPDNYMFLLRASRAVEKIKNQKLNIDLSEISSESFRLPVKNFINRVKNSSHVCDYDIFGTKTGRLSTVKNSFPILTMDRRYRKILKPTNDWFVEFDFNAAELRTVLALAGHKQPSIDLHQWNIDNVFDSVVDREEAKKRIFSWLYNPSSNDSQAEKFYNRGELLSNHYLNGTVTTPFGRKIEADDYHAFNYLIQSASSDNTILQMLRMMSMLEESNSFVAFTMHDSVIIDLDHEERDMIPILAYTFSETNLGRFLPNITAGKNFGEMRDLSI
jgi:hypothetical protein